MKNPFRERHTHPDAAHVSSFEKGTDLHLQRCMIGYQAGDANSFTELHAALEPQLRAYLSSLCMDRSRTDDLVQEVFLAIHRSRQTYSPERPLKPWAFAIARHIYASDARSSSRRNARERSKASEEKYLEAEFDRLLARDSIQRGISRLPALQRECLVLHHALGFSFKEIGAILGVMAATAKVRAHRGMKQLRQAMDDDGQV